MKEAKNNSRKMENSSARIFINRLEAGKNKRSETLRLAGGNRIKELKADFGFDSFNLDDFFGTEAALSFAMLAYNLMALFRQQVLNTKVQHTLSTLRYKTFAVGAYFENQDGKYILKMALHRKRREWFSGLWASSKSIQLPFEFFNA